MAPRVKLFRLIYTYNVRSQEAETRVDLAKRRAFVGVRHTLHTYLYQFSKAKYDKIQAQSRARKIKIARNSRKKTITKTG